MVDSIFDQLSNIQSLLSEIKLFSTDTSPYKENDDKKYYKLTCNIMFNTYYKYVVVDGNNELSNEIKKFGEEISEDDQRRIECVEVTVKDCLQDFIDSYEKKIQKWYFLSNWDASQGRTPKMDAIFEEVRNSPVFHTYSALRKWERFENYRAELLKLCESTGASIGEYSAYLNCLEKASDIDAEYLSIRNEQKLKLESKFSSRLNKFPSRIGKNTVSNCSYEINEDKLKFLFWEVEYNGDCRNPFREMPAEIACILTDTKLNVIDSWQYTKNQSAPRGLKEKLEEVLKENYLMIFGWPADFMSLRHFLSPNTYMTCDLGTLYTRIVGKRVPLDKISEIILGDEDFSSDSSITDARRILAIFKELCNLRGESPCDMIRFFQMELSNK